MKYAYKGEKWHLVLQPMHVAKCIVLYGNTVTDSWIDDPCIVQLFYNIYDQENTGHICTNKLHSGLHIEV